MDNEQKLNEIFLRLFSYTFPEEFKDTSLFEEPMYMRARYYMMLLIEVERVFGIRFSDTLIDEMKLTTYQGLLHEINNLTSHTVPHNVKNDMAIVYEKV